ncbi:MAG: SufE family protein [Lonepinella koalarum]|nr:SufE family protein [Lonepinella koalarum]
MLIEQIKQAQHWEDRYRLLIQGGKQIPTPNESELTDWIAIQGCEAGLWVKISLNTDRTLAFQAYSEARIINGLLQVLTEALKGKTPEQIQSFSISCIFNELGIAQRLSNTRLNGLKQIEMLIKQLI